MRGTARLFAVASVALASGVGGYFLGQHHSVPQTGPAIIKVQDQSDSDQPIAIFELPKNIDSTRFPAKDTITPAGAKMNTPAKKIVITPGIVNAWNSYILSGAYIKAHRHPNFRILVPEDNADLTRVNAQGQKETLQLRQGTVMVFAPDAWERFHNDYNSGKNPVKVTVIEIGPAP